MTTYWISFAAALATTLALTPVARAVALRAGIIDCPDGRRKLQKIPIPLLGGVAVFGGWWLGLALTAALGWPVRLPAAMPQAALTLVALSLLGVCDDAWNLRARWKLAAQIVATLPLALSGHGLGQVACFGWTVDLGSWGPAATALWLIVGINALNLIDGMDGMASLTGLGICVTAAAVDLHCGDGQAAMFALGLGGALAGFLAFNFPPARIYLGDAGSMVIGLAVSLASMRAARTPTGITNLTPMIGLMALPLTDTALAVMRRSLSGRGIWYPDRGHIHHRLLDRGLTPRRVLTLVAGFSLLWGCVVVTAAGAAAEGLACLTAALMLLAAVHWKLAGHHEWAQLAEVIRVAFRARADRPNLAALESLTFAQAWRRLETSIERYPVERLTILVQQADGTLREHDWFKSSTTAQPLESLAIEVQRSAAQGSSCRLRVETAGRNVAPQLPKVLALLETFGDFWAAHPSTVPAASLPPLNVHESTAAPVRQEQHRAA